MLQGVFAHDFEILSPLAEGGMGAVYVARQISTGKRRAIKIMQPELVADARARERFMLEATIASRIESEHVVEVLAAGVDERSGTPWLAMELLEGQDLASYVAQRQRLPPAEVWEIFRQLGHALAAAHRQGIVHRDVKPENVFITRSRRVDAPLLVKVLDFGIAKLTQEGMGKSKRTAAVGSPLWMAPEQTDATMTPTPSADVWAIGLMAFHALTGRYFWRAANDAEPRIPVLFAEILTQPFPAASVRAQELGVPGLLPASFDGWFGLCVNRDPAQRFRDAAPAIAALEPVLSSGVSGGYAGRREQAVAPTMAATGPAQGPPPGLAYAPYTPPPPAPYTAPPPAPYTPPPVVTAPLPTPPRSATPAVGVLPTAAMPATPYPPTQAVARAGFPSATPYVAAPPPPPSPEPTRRPWLVIAMLAGGVLFALGGIAIAVIAVIIGPGGLRPSEPSDRPSDAPAVVASVPPPSAPVTDVAPPPQPSTAVGTTDGTGVLPPPTTAADPSAEAPPTSDTSDASPPPTTSDDAEDDTERAPFDWADGAQATVRGRCHYPELDYTFTFTLTRSGQVVNGTGTAVVRRVSPDVHDVTVGATAHWTFMGSRTATTLSLMDNEGTQYDFRVRRDGGVSGETSTHGRLTGRFAR